MNSAAAATATAARTIRSTTLNNAEAPSLAGDIIYVHSGGATTTGNLAMDANPTLQGAGGDVLAERRLTIAAGHAPTLTGTVTLADNTAIRTVNFSGAAPAMAASGLRRRRPIVIDQVNVTGGTNALSLTNVTATATGAINVSNASFTQHERRRSAVNRRQHPGDARSPRRSAATPAGRSTSRTAPAARSPSTAPITDTGPGVFLNANTGRPSTSPAAWR